MTRHPYREGVTAVPERIRVLIADDSPEVRQSIRAMLDLDGGFAVVGEAGDGQGAVEATRRLQPDVILMDVHMPVLDGISATEAITAVPGATCAVVIVSVQGEPEYLERARRAGARDYLVKPFGFEELVRALRRAAGRSADPSESASGGAPGPGIPGAAPPRARGRTGRASGAAQRAASGLTARRGFPTLDLAWKFIWPDEGPGRVPARLFHHPGSTDWGPG